MKKLPMKLIPPTGGTRFIRDYHRRRALRRGVEVDCQVVAERDFRLLGSQTMDLSPEGMLLRSDAEVTLGEEVYVALKPPGSGWWIDAVARVARIVAGRRTGDRGRGIGLEFVSMDPVDRAMLRGRLLGYPPPLPWRAPQADYLAMIQSIT